MTNHMKRIPISGPRIKSAKTARILATWFGVGLLPKAPGTWGSLAALPLGYAVIYWANLELFCVLTAFSFIIGIWASSIASKEIGTTDPSEIVIDEVVGQSIVLITIPPNIILYFFGFILFRFFDIIKPWPISWVDKQIKGGFGIMIDDVLAAIFAGVILWLGQFAYQNYT
jgi:phosphatidylglycerophosphatase A